MQPEMISLVLPVYNEGDNIVTSVRGLERALAGHDHELLICYDFDEDTTLAALDAQARLPASLRRVKNDRGKGVINAIRSGFAAARGDAIITVMADLSDPPEVILPMVERLRAGAAVVAGSRYMPGGSQSGGPLLKSTLSRLCGLSLHWVAQLGTHDATTNFRGYRRDFLESVTIESASGFELALELTVKAHLAGLKVDEVPSQWRERVAGVSRFRLAEWLPSYLHWYWMAMRPALEEHVLRRRRSKAA
ncbi:MAG TPA: glycosyltransferase [Polyangiales bacterium]|nr:glycosyltransferase [Polyangiales bacterium]